MKLSIKPIFFVIAILCGLTLFILSASGEGQVWDCPCGRTGNTGNYCGECAHPAPWIETTDSPSATVTPTSTPQPATVPTPEPVPNTLKAGDSIVFGNYEQDTNPENGKEKIEWMVLDVDKTKCLLVSKYGLDVKPYNKSNANTTWEKCSLRKWLNEDFYSQAFSEKEKSAIILTHVDNSMEQGYADYKQNGGNNTDDYVFLLSYNEAFNMYFTSDETRICPLTEYAVSKGAYVRSNYKISGRSTGVYWLRSPGRNKSNATRVSKEGQIRCDKVSRKDVAVRPAIWVNIEADVF